MKTAWPLAIVASMAGAPPLLAGAADAQPAQKAPLPFETRVAPKTAFEAAPRIRGFSVALVLGEMQGSATPDNLPAGAEKALDDMRGFLPYKSFRLLDTQWILCCATGGFAEMTPPTLVGRLRGAEEQEYQFGVTILDVSGPQLSVRFAMNHAGSVMKKTSEAVSESRALERAMAQQRLLVARQELNILNAQLVSEKSSNHPAARAARAKVDRLERELHELTQESGGKGAVIDSTFSMDIGETVVIGTSSLKGDKALIALLTAAPRSSDPVK